MKKKIITIFSLLVLAVFLSQIVAAQGIFNSPGFKPLKDAFGYKADWPPFGTGQKEKIELGIVILVWIALFALIYVLINFIPAFKESTHKNAITWFAFAFAGIAVTSTSFVNQVAALMDITSSILFIIGFVVIIFVAIGLLMRGTALGGGLGAGAAEELAKAHGKAEKEIHEANKMRRDVSQEKQTWQKEDKAIRQAENLITLDIKTLGNVEQQIQHLIDVITRITQVRNEGEALRLKQQFHRQAAAVASEITRNMQLDVQLKNLEGAITQLDHVEVKVLTQLDNEMRAAATTATRQAGIQTWFNTHDVAIRRFRAEQARLITEMQPLVTDVPNLTGEIEDMMEAVIRDVNNNQYPEAVSNLNHALNNARREQSILANIASLLTRSRRTLNRIQPALNQITHIPP